MESNQNQIIKTTVSELREHFKDGGEEEYEYYNETTGTWESLKDSYYMERNTGFPIPEKALEPICLIQIYDNKSETMIIFGLKEWIYKDEYKFDFEVKYIQCRDEIDLLEKFLQVFNKLDPLIIYAWNGTGENGFDFPYLYNRLKNNNMDVNRLSNYGNVNLQFREFQGKSIFTFRSDGHFYIDMMDVYKKFVFKPKPNYQLNTIAELDLKENKVQTSEYITFDDFYTGNYTIPEDPTPQQKECPIYQAAINGKWDEVKERSHSKFIYYGAKDTYLIKRIDNQQNFTGMMCMIAEKMGVQIGDSLGTVKPWSQFLLCTAHLNNQIMPKQQDHPDPNVVGGHVRETIPGIHRWVLSADVNSMYPLLGMVGFNMSPETFIPKYNLPDDLKDIILKYFNDQEEANRFKISKEIWDLTTQKLKEYNLSLAINGAVFKRDKIGIIPELVQEIYNSRKAWKKQMFKYKARKILIQEILKSK